MITTQGISSSLSAQRELPIGLFDSGVGGMTLNKLADKLARLAEQRQMLLITHWPQLAARAQRHFQVSKQIRGNSTFTVCARLGAADRHAELARMAGGGAQGEAVAGSLEKEGQAADEGL